MRRENEEDYSGMVKNISGALAAGLIAALLQCVGIQLLGHFGVTSFHGISLTPKLTMAWLYPRLVWGSIWGLLFAFPLFKDQPFWRGILFSMGPTLMVFLKFVPGMGKSVLGFTFGSLAPELVLLLNIGWGIIAAFWYRESQR